MLARKVQMFFTASLLRADNTKTVPFLFLLIALFTLQSSTLMKLCCIWTIKRAWHIMYPMTLTDSLTDSNSLFPPTHKRSPSLTFPEIVLPGYYNSLQLQRHPFRSRSRSKYQKRLSFSNQLFSAFRSAMRQDNRPESCKPQRSRV